jgi:hypothetical protein
MISPELNTLLCLVWLHFVADFLLQTDKMARNKSTSNRWLLAHVCTYSLPMMWFGWQFAVFNGAIHFVVDFITSRGTKKLWAAEQVHWFFALIGFDQAVHLTTLVLTFSILKIQ